MPDNRNGLVSLQLYVTPELRDRLKRVALAQRTTVAELVRDLIDQGTQYDPGPELMDEYRQRLETHKRSIALDGGPLIG